MYNFINELKEQINRKLTEQQLDFYTKNVLKNIEINSDGSLNYIWYKKHYLKESSYKIDLVIKKSMSVGARKPIRRHINNKIFKKIKRINWKIYIDNIKIDEGLFKKLCSINNNNGLLRNVIIFSNSKIKNSFEK